MRKANRSYNKIKSSLAFSRMDPYYDLDGASRKMSFDRSHNHFRPRSAKK